MFWPICHFVLVFFYATICSANCLSDLYKKHREVPAIYRREYLQIGDIREIRAIFLNYGLSDSDKLKKSYTVYLKARLRNFPEEEKNFLLSKLEQLPVYANDKGQFVANPSIIRMPEDLIQTVQVYGAIIHEFEHLIQFRNIELSSTKKSRKLMAYLFFKTFFTSRSKYYYEYGAMKAEWEFLHFVPPKYIDEAKKIVRRDLKDNYMRISILNMLDNVHRPLVEYIASQHKFGRYSHDVLRVEAFFRIAVVSGIIATPILAMTQKEKMNICPRILACTEYELCVFVCQQEGIDIFSF